MTDDREPFREARAAGLKARQERRLENATYTAAEVKVLTEAALRLGRKEALEEAAAGILLPRPEGREQLDDQNVSYIDVKIHKALWDAIQAARVASQDPTDAPEPRTQAPGYSDLPQESQAARSPQGEPTP